MRMEHDLGWDRCTRLGSLFIVTLALCLGVGCPDGADDDDDATGPGDDDATSDDDDATSDDDDQTPGDDDDVAWTLGTEGLYPSPGVTIPTSEVSIEPPAGVTEVDQTVSTDFAEAVEFLYTGGSPVQVGVDPLDIETHRVAVVRGRVLQADGSGLEDVEVTILGHGEYGRTFTRADGGFDMAVNGGGRLTVRYRAEGYVPVQRKVRTSWRRFTWLPDVVMLPYDGDVTTVDLTNATSLQVARGSVQQDADGTRQATMLFSPGTEATLIHEDGTEEPLDTLEVRATEFTVGENGPDAMPGDLPSTSAFTYAVELSVDEAVDAGAVSVEFTEPVIYYVDNFLGFPAGTTVPTGYYDRTAGEWVASDSGIVIDVLSTGGLEAEVDVDGSGVAADQTALDELGFDAEELEELATSYSAGDSLWRVPILHFTPWDLNWGWGPPDDAIWPDGGPWWGDDLDDTCYDDGSIIECHNQILGESIWVTGTPFSLNYGSNRVEGYDVGRSLDIQITGDTVPVSLLEVLVDIEVAGRQYHEEFGNEAGQAWRFSEWDGFDAYGREIQGQTSIEVCIGYVYGGVYEDTDVFGYNGDGEEITGDPSRQEVTFWECWMDTIGILEANAAGLGGWTINPHHAYDVVGETVYFGDGTRQSAASVGAVVWPFAGTGTSSYYGEANGEPALAFDLGYSSGYLVTADDAGGLYIADGDYIRYVDPDGAIWDVAGNGHYASGCDDGDDVTNCLPYVGQGIAYGEENGWLYGADYTVIWGVDPDGEYHVLHDYEEDTYHGLVPESMWGEFYFDEVVAAPDNDVYALRYHVYRIGHDGVAYHVAGNGDDYFGADGSPAVDSGGILSKIAVSPDGTLYVAGADRGYPTQTLIFRVDDQGEMHHVTGPTADHTCDVTDGMLASSWAPNTTPRLAFGPDGSLYVGDDWCDVIFRIDPDGIMYTFAGGGSSTEDGALATDAQLAIPDGLSVAPDGTVYLAQADDIRVLQIRAPYPTEVAGEHAVMAEGGGEIYFFDADGRHLRTTHALTGATLFEFEYEDGLLVEIIDGDGNVTTIERGGDGVPTAIVAPGGQTTDLDLDGSGYLRGVTNPASESFVMDNRSTGLLQDFTPPRGYGSHYTYFADGTLWIAEDAAGATKTLTRDDHIGGREITIESPLGRVRVFGSEQSEEGVVRQTVTSATGATSETVHHLDSSVETVRPDGVTVVTEHGPEPRWGMSTPMGEAVTITTQGGLNAVVTHEREVALDDPQDLLSLATQTDTTIINGRTYTRVFDEAGQRITYTSPEEREIVVYVDDLLRATEIELDPAIEPIYIDYDARGRVDLIAQGDRSADLEYDALDRLETVEDALGRQVRYAYDDADRVTAVSLPSTDEYGFDYDVNGNLTELEMPSLVVHELDYDVLDFRDTYTPPGASDPYDADFDLDRLPDLLTLPTGRTIDYEFETPVDGDRLLTISYDEATAAYGYDDDTARVGSVTCTPMYGGTPQDLSFDYDGPLVTRVTASGAADGEYSYTYDNDFLVETITLTTGSETEEVVLYRDSDGLVERIGTFDVDHLGPLGLVNEISDETGSITYEYDSLGRPWITTHTVHGTEILQTELHYDAANRIEFRYESRDGDLIVHHYTYDLDGQLIGVTQDGLTTEAYTYDLNGNRDTTLTGSAQYDDLDRITVQDGVSYAHDDDGYLVQRDADSFVYSARGELLEATVGGDTVTYDYDGFARRVARSDDAGTTQYLYGNLAAPFQLTASRAPDGVLTTYHYDTAGHLMALERGDPWDQAAWYYVATCPVGTPRVVTDASGNVVREFEHDSYGVRLFDSDPGFEIEVGFAGGIADPVTGLVRFGYRDYEPETGRWTARDPILFAGGQANLFVYVGNDPVNWFDPSGLDGIYIHYDGYPITTPWGEMPLGHAAVVAVDPETGSTRYYEYGRYDGDFGNVRRRTIPDVEIGCDGKPTPESLENLYGYLSEHYGKGAHVSANYTALADYQKIIDFAEDRMNDPNRSPYSWNPLCPNHCKSFAMEALNAATSTWGF